MDEFSKKLIVGVTRAMFNHLYVPKYHAHNQCLRWAGLTRYVFLAFQNRGLIDKTLCPLIQAGTAQWRYKSGEDDDDCYFSYSFNQEDLMRHLDRGTGENVEWHVWLGIRETNEIVDLTTPHQPKQLADTAINLPRNTQWEREHALPDFIWHEAHTAFDAGWQYLPHELACAVATNTWANTIKVHDLQTPSDLSRLFAYCLATFRP